MTAPDVPDGWRRALTPTEVHVVELVSRGLTDQQVAKQLDRSPSTIRTHMRNAAKVTGCPGRAGIVGAAFRAGVIR